MKTHSALTDDDGVRWEFTYDEQMFVSVRDALGNLVMREDGRPDTTSKIVDFLYRVEGEHTWHSLPSWADIKDEWKINLCFFDEDEDGEIERYWEVTS